MQQMPAFEHYPRSQTQFHRGVSEFTMATGNDHLVAIRTTIARQATAAKAKQALYGRGVRTERGPRSYPKFWLLTRAPYKLTPFNLPNNPGVIREPPKLSGVKSNTENNPEI